MRRSTNAGLAAIVAILAVAGCGLASIALRFQQNCEGLAAALRGKISWAR